jgi:hypothetical protein
VILAISSATVSGADFSGLAAGSFRRFDGVSSGVDDPRAVVQ